ncbi:hypothetical protein [Bacillus sp. ISL-55]|uniref:hypothetical protein n=1 Tax=Bacillus sp. ISL-55 TaxID=2819134 RepID=UPI001BEC37AB|nr:hypothetical protein [Bacillus sp. ISL-55]MBT2692757.1 hypothetical protein [Bacillus sp. ISL-55]
MVYFLIVISLLLFTKQTGFNLSGVQYQFNQETMTMTIEKGVWDKQVDERQVTAQEALEIMMPINEANQLWKMNIYLISFFAAVFIALFFTPLRPKKYFKWYVFMYFILLAAFVIWDVTVHKELAGEIVVTLKGL